MGICRLKQVFPGSWLDLMDQRLFQTFLLEFVEDSHPSTANE